MSNPMPTKKQVKKYTFEEVKSVIKRIYAIHGHNDSWNVSVIYENIMLDKLPSYLRSSAKSLTPPKKKTK